MSDLATGVAGITVGDHVAFSPDSHMELVEGHDVTKMSTAEILELVEAGGIGKHCRHKYNRYEGYESH